MKKARFFVLLLSLFIVVFFCGCEEEEALTDQQVLEKANTAFSEVNSYSFEMDYDQTLIVPDLMEIVTSVETTGEVIEEPYAMFMKMKMEMDDVPFNIESYLVGDLMYMYMEELGWIYMDISEEMAFADLIDDPAIFFSALDNLDSENIVFDLDDGYYVMDLKDDTGEFMNQMMEQILAESGEDYRDLFDEILFSDIEYRLTLDAENFYPVEIEFSFNAISEFMDESMEIVQAGIITMFNHGTINEIIVPDEVKEEAINIDDLM